MAITIFNSWVFYITVLVSKEVVFVEIMESVMAVSFITYCICTLFLGLYDEIILALVLSIAIDKDLNNGKST